MSREGSAVQALAGAVERLAALLANADDATLDSRGWGWGEYERIRMALIGTVQDLDDLSAELMVQRSAQGLAPTLAQRLLGHYHAAYWDLRALLAGLSEKVFTTPPAPGEWPVQTTLIHIYRTDRGFLATILIGLAAQQAGIERTFDGEEAQQITARAEPAPGDHDSLEQVENAYIRLHTLILNTLIPLHDAELEARAPFWEVEQPSVRFRMGRFTAHLHEHTIQIEKTLAVVAPGGEARQHIRRLYRALAGVEAALFGVPELEERCRPLAEHIAERVVAVTETLQGRRQLFAAVDSGDIEGARRLLGANPQLANVTGDDHLDILITAVYRGQGEIVQLLRDAGADLDLFSAAAVGELSEIEAHYNWNPKTINWISRDGFTPLQLAAFFRQEAVVHYLLARGADVHAVSRNDMCVQPLHAAVAGRNLAIVQALLDAGADVHAQQSGGYTPLQAALQNGDEAIVQALRNAGAVM